MFESLINGSDLQKGLFVSVVGIMGVFLVLILFYLFIKVLSKMFPYKPEESSENK